MEANILLFIQNTIRNPYLTPIMKGITHLGDAGIFWVLLTILLLAHPKTRRIGWSSMIALVLSLIVNNLILKNLVARVRPYEVIEGLKLLVAKADDYSFPSGHSGASFAAAFAIFCTAPRRYGIPALVLAGLIALSRLYVGIHYPTDVLGGVVIGCILGYIASRIKMPDKLQGSRSL